MILISSLIIEITTNRTPSLTLLLVVIIIISSINYIWFIIGFRGRLICILWSFLLFLYPWLILWSILLWEPFSYLPSSFCFLPFLIFVSPQSTELLIFFLYFSFIRLEFDSCKSVRRYTWNIMIFCRFSWCSGTLTKLIWLFVFLFPQKLMLFGLRIWCLNLLNENIVILINLIINLLLLKTLIWL